MEEAAKNFIFIMFFFNRTHFSMKLNTEIWVFAIRMIRDPHQVSLQVSVIILQF